LGLITSRSHLGPITDDLHAHIANRKAGVTNQSHNLGEQLRSRRARPLGAIRSEDGSEVAELSGGQ
jgi:hypothetical protein